ncbi:NADP-dependent oxidoreductase [Arthrobacter pigmenti]
MTKVYVFNDFGGAEQQQVIDRASPWPAAGQLAIKVRAAGVNPADWKIREGQMGRKWSLPAPTGREAAGVVTAVGEGVDGFAVGDEVLGAVANGYGGLAEHTILEASNSVAKPGEISWADAATLPVAGATAYDVTHQVELEAGQILLIIGAGGGVGRMAAQIGAVHEFRVLGVAHADKRETVEATGAEFIEAGADIADRVRAAAPDGVDLIVDLVGGETLHAVAGTAKDPSRIITTADPKTARRLGGEPVERTNEALAKITDVVKYEVVNPYVTARFSLEDAGKALAAVEAGHAEGKVVVEP